MVAKGVLDYLGPGRLGKRVDTPYRETTTIADGEVTIQRGERKPRHVGLERVPELDGFLRGFSALLGGDATSLSRDFELAAHGTQAQWQLQLAPRDARLRKHIASIRVDGSGTAARCFSIIDADGDARVLLVESLADTHLPAELDSAVVQTLCQGGDAAQ